MINIDLGSYLSYMAGSESSYAIWEHAMPHTDQYFVVLLHLGPVDIELAHCFIQDALAEAHTRADEAVGECPQ